MCEEQERNTAERADARLEKEGREVKEETSAAGLIGFIGIRPCQDEACPKFVKRISTVKYAIPSHDEQRLSERIKCVLPGVQPDEGYGWGLSWNAVQLLGHSPATMSSTSARLTTSVPPQKPKKGIPELENLAETDLCPSPDRHTRPAFHINMITVDQNDKWFTNDHEMDHDSSDFGVMPPLRFSSANRGVRPINYANS